MFILHRLASVFRSNKPTLLPPLYEGESLACRVLDVNPSGVKFLQPVYLELPHFSALRDGERELVVLRTQDGGWNWQEVCVEDMKGTRMMYCCRFLEKPSKIAANNEINQPETVAKSDTAIQKSVSSAGKRAAGSKVSIWCQAQEIVYDKREKHMQHTKRRKYAGILAPLSRLQTWKNVPPAPAKAYSCLNKVWADTTF